MSVILWLNSAESCYVVRVKHVKTLWGMVITSPIISNPDDIHSHRRNCRSSIIEFQSPEELKNFSNHTRHFHTGNFHLLLRFPHSKSLLKLDQLTNVETYSTIDDISFSETLARLLSVRQAKDLKMTSPKRRNFEGRKVIVGYFPRAPFTHASPIGIATNKTAYTPIQLEPKDWLGYELKLLWELSQAINIVVYLRRTANNNWGGRFNASGDGKFDPGLHNDLLEGVTEMTMTTPFLQQKTWINFDYTITPTGMR